MNAVDAFFSGVWGFPLKILCGVTGKNNFFFAKLTYISSVICLLFFVGYRIHSENDISFTVISITFWLFMYFGAYMPIYAAITYSEKHDDSGSDVSATPIIHRYVFARIWLAAFSWVGLVIDLVYYNHINLFLDISFVLLSGAIYLASHNIPGKKSWVKIGIEKLVSALKRIRVPAPVPLPVPT